MIVRLYVMLTRISGWIEDWRVALLIRVYGVANNESKPPTDWREREKLPSAEEWPTTTMSRKGTIMEDRVPRKILLIGAVKVGPVHPVPAPPEFYKDSNG